MASILVIDDEPNMRAALERHLMAGGHEVSVAGNGAEAMEMVERRPVDLVITDLYMPGMDGVEFTIRLRQGHPDVKVIAISGGGWKNNAEALELARRVGAHRTLPKPFQQDELLATVDSVLERE